jgi:hypothetical protein
VRAVHALGATQERLAEFLMSVLARQAALLTHVTASLGQPGSLHEFLLDEARFGALDLGLPALPEGVEARVAELCAEPAA